VAEETRIGPIGRRRFLTRLAALGSGAAGACRGRPDRTLYVVPNFHPACMGWLAPYSVERNYCLYSYLDHQDRAVQDPEYHYVMSEIPHLITMLERRPERFAELARLAANGKVELVNAFVLEPTVNLSGGEALVMQGVVGLDWYRQVLRVRPRHCWMIDVCGWHEQMAQIARGLGLETFVYSRYNPTGTADSPHGVSERMEALHWMESPDGSRVLGVNPGHYSEALREVMAAAEALPRERIIEELSRLVERQQARFPKAAPLLAMAGQGDYSLPFAYKGYPRELIEIWRSTRPRVALRFSTLSEWYEEFLRARERLRLTVVRSGSRIYGWSAFWVNAPQMKQRFRRDEHLLQATEALATCASLRRGLKYPSQELWNAWLLLALNMDRNSLWGAAVHAVYEHPRSWDIRDRFDTLEQICRSSNEGALSALTEPDKDSLALFNPLGFKRAGPVELRLPPNRVPADARAQLLEDGQTALCELEAPAMGFAHLRLRPGAPERPRPVELSEVETEFYLARVDASGALVSLRVKPSGREMLAGAADVLAEVRAEKHQKQVFAHEIPVRGERVPVMSAGAQRAKVRVLRGPLATIVETTSPFPGGSLRRVTRFYNRSPRIDFLTETENLPHGTIVSAVFPLAGEIAEIRRAIPGGFSHGSWPAPSPEAPGRNGGIIPAIRWSHYALRGGGGVALLDRGVPAREIDGNTVILLLHNATNEYYWDKDCRWTSGAGKQRFEYALLAHDGDWRQARVPQRAYEYNAPLVAAPGRPFEGGPGPWLECSDNLVLEALRRVDDEIEIRAVECYGAGGQATLRVRLPHQGAALTDLAGERRTALAAATAGAPGAEYRFTVRPQQIVTVRLKAAARVTAVAALRTFDPIVPENKRAGTRSFDHPELKGHPPRKPGEERLFLDLEQKL
jgi:alpha-mannosidase